MTLKEAMAQGIRRVRLAHWFSPNAYIYLDPHIKFFSKSVMKFYDPDRQKAMGHPTPQVIPYLDALDKRWVAYTGPRAAEDTDKP